jgi:hypothetical protein
MRGADPALGTPRLDAETLAALAEGRDLGARHDDVLEILAASAADQAALRVLLGMAPASAALAMALAPNVVALRSVRPVRWVGYALAAGLGLLAVGLALRDPRHAPTPEPSTASRIAERPDAAGGPAPGDRILAVSYEGELVATEPPAERDDAIFSGAFDT